MLKNTDLVSDECVQSSRRGPVAISIVCQRGVMPYYNLFCNFAIMLLFND